MSKSKKSITKAAEKLAEARATIAVERRQRVALEEKNAERETQAAAAVAAATPPAPVDSPAMAAFRAAKASSDPYSQLRAGEILRTDRAVLEQSLRESSARDGRQYVP